MKVHVQNFQSLADATIEAEGLTVIVGKSNLGKSALVRAISAALFNRAGDDFVRVGADTARVSLHGLPTAAGPLLEVVWQKGGGYNQFEVNGALFAKVGGGAPPVLDGAGYRDVLVGKEPIRPQVAEQFEGLFLLDRSGAFVSDALSLVSHLGTLLVADRHCGLDLKREKGMLAVRTGDRDTAVLKLAALQPIADLHARVAQLGATIAHVRAREAHIRDAKGLIARRAQLRQVIAHPMPVRVERIAQVDEWGARVKELREAIAHRDAQTEKVYRARAAGKSAQQEAEQVKAALDDALASLKVCPICDRPMEVASAAVR